MKILSISVVILSIISSKAYNLVKYTEFFASLIDNLSKVSTRISTLNLNKV